MSWHLSRDGFEVLLLPPFERFAFDFLPCREDVMVAAEVDIGRCDVLERLVVAVVVVVIHKAGDLFFQLLGVIVMLQRHQVFHGPVIALDLALGHRVIRGAPDMADVPV